MQVFLGFSKPKSIWIKKCRSKIPNWNVFGIWQHAFSVWRIIRLQNLHKIKKLSKKSSLESKKIVWIPNLQSEFPNVCEKVKAFFLSGLVQPN